MLAIRPQTPAEETANALSHGLGFLASLIGGPLLVANAAQTGDSSGLIGAIVFALAMSFLYFCSTVYHTLPQGRSKYRLLRIEHAAIFLLIAGTYTPFTLGILKGFWGWVLFATVWTLAIAGVILKIRRKAPSSLALTSLYVIMGWSVVIAIGPLVERIPFEGFSLLLAGGLAYTIGVVFFLTDSRVRFGHFIWHLFVLAGTGFHYCAVFWYAG